MGRRHKRHDDDHEEHPSEAWLIALADMMTLLMVTFLMMFAISSLDLKKFQTFKAGFAKGTGTSLPALPGEGVPGEGDVYEKPVAPKSGDVPAASPTPTAPAPAAPPAPDVLDSAELQELQRKLTAQLAKAGLTDKVQARITARGLVVHITDGVLFDSGRAQVTRQGDALLDGLGVALAGVGNDLVVEGHTDKRPIATREFPSNWELSVMRATAVGRRLIEAADIPPQRVSMAGYGETRPRQDAASEAAYAANRRVEIVVQLPPAAPGA